MTRTPVGFGVSDMSGCGIVGGLAPSVGRIAGITPIFGRPAFTISLALIISLILATASVANYTVIQ